MALRSISLFRQLCRTARFLPSENEKVEALADIRRGFLENKNLSNEEEIQSLLKRGDDQLRFLRVKARKSEYSKVRKPKTRVVVQEDGTIIETDEFNRSKDFAFCKDMRLDRDDLKRHNQLMKRANNIKW